MRLPMLSQRLFASGFLAATLSVGSANGFAKDTGLIFVSIENNTGCHSGRPHPAGIVIDD
jgi:hypothetical protein